LHPPAPQLQIQKPRYPPRKQLLRQGKTRPINSPVSIKMIPRTPINPKVETTELASKKFIRSGYPTHRAAIDMYEFALFGVSALTLRQSRA
jgi:hypothetical protein